MIDLSAPSITITHGYDLAGNQTSIIDATGETTDVYDEINFPITIAQPNGTITYTYDAINCLTLTEDGVTTNNYAYDKADRLTGVTGDTSLNFTGTKMGRC